MTTKYFGGFSSNLLTTSGDVLSEKIIIKSVRNIGAFLEPRRFIIIFIEAFGWFLILMKTNPVQPRVLVKNFSVVQNNALKSEALL
jgi:hypothetical protein